MEERVKDITKTGRVPKFRRDEVVKALARLIETGKILGLSAETLSDRFDISRQTINKYLNELYDSIPPEDINHTRVKIQVMFDILFTDVQKMIDKSKKPREKKEAIELMLKMIDRFTIFLESFHIKAKAQENIVVGVEKQLVIVQNETLAEVKQIEDVEDETIPDNS